MKKRLISISLAVLLAMGLGIMIFPTQAVEASHEHRQGIVFHIEAEGPATFNQVYPSQSEMNGELYIKLDGNGYFWNMGIVLDLGAYGVRKCSFLVDDIYLFFGNEDVLFFHHLRNGRDAYHDGDQLLVEVLQ